MSKQNVEIREIEDGFLVEDDFFGEEHFFPKFEDARYKALSLFDTWIKDIKE